jgi:hypothetical protein
VNVGKASAGLIAGRGDNAHVYDELAFQFTDRFHVIGITRREFGRSGQPAGGYDIDTRVHDDIALLNRITPPYRTPYYSSLTTAQQGELDRDVGALATWTGGAMQRFRSGVRSARVVEIPNTNHSVYVVDEPLVVREMRHIAHARTPSGVRE